MVGVGNLIGNFDGLKNRSMFDGTAANPTRLRVKVDVFNVGRERQWWICKVGNVIIYTFRASQRH